MQPTAAADVKISLFSPFAALEMSFLVSLFFPSTLFDLLVVLPQHSVRANMVSPYSGHTISATLWVCIAAHNSGGLNEQDYIQRAHTADLNPSEC